MAIHIDVGGIESADPVVALCGAPDVTKGTWHVAYSDQTLAAGVTCQACLDHPGLAIHQIKYLGERV